MESNLIASIFIFCGSLVVLIAAIGAWRFPDTLTRMAAISKSTTLGGLLIFIGALFHKSLNESFNQILFICFFLFVASPVASHLLGRAGLMKKLPLSPRTQCNDFEKYKDLL